MTKKGNQKQEKEKEKEVILKDIFACNINTRASNHFSDSLRKYKKTKKKIVVNDKRGEKRKKEVKSTCHVPNIKTYTYIYIQPYFN